MPGQKSRPIGGMEYGSTVILKLWKGSQVTLLIVIGVVCATTILNSCTVFPINITLVGFSTPQKPELMF